MRALAHLGRAIHLARRIAGRAEAEYQRALIARHTQAPALAGPGYMTGLPAMRIGSNVHLGRGFFIRAEGGLTIGDNTHISHRLTVYTVNHRHDGTLLPFDDTLTARPVSIGRNVWIGIGVTLLPGARICDGAIIGAGAVVAGEVGRGQIFGAAQAAPLKARVASHYDRLEAAGAYSGPGGRPLS
ncbi:acyltransferase [Pseudoroseicyclus sp. H15]